ncbi:thioredoxin [Halopseudomonas salegens]|uniref:Thioredoxin n=1 Tax=Halopseudomonas salegens TaxID=1434072 RepID=A0A1H2EH33_9GAMM|nr:thioredoxin [Halopseudomonas salegens]SDT94446.1 thioredoxin [Halopseudomonas salegens]
MSDYIFDVSEADFDRYVIENSHHKPVLVDFWAEWCAPCKALMPLLAKITEDYAGEMLLAKVDCDAHPGLTQRFGIRSLPTVVLFKDGQPVEGFSGAQPESAIRELLAPHVSAPVIDSEATDIGAQAEALIAAGNLATATELLQHALTDTPDDRLWLLLASALAEQDLLTEATEALSRLQDKDANRQAINGIKAQISFRQQASDLPPRESLEQRVASNPSDSEALYQLAIIDLAAQQAEQALPRLLTLLQQDRGYADNSPQRTLLEVFDLLGNDHPLTIEYRRKLYQALY